MVQNKTYKIRYKGFIYRLYAENNCLHLTLQRADSEIEKDVGIYYPDQEKIFKYVKDGNIFKKYNGFGIGNFWLKLFSPKLLEFKYKGRVYQVELDKAVIEKSLLVKYENYEIQRIFPKEVCKIISKK